MNCGCCSSIRSRKAPDKKVTYKVEWEKEYNETYKNSLHKFDSIITLCEYYYINFDSLYFEKYNKKTLFYNILLHTITIFV